MSTIVNVSDIITGVKQIKEQLTILQKDILRSLVVIDDVDNIHIDQETAKKVVETIQSCKQNLGSCDALLCGLVHDKVLKWGDM